MASTMGSALVVVWCHTERETALDRAAPLLLEGGALLRRSVACCLRGWGCCLWGSELCPLLWSACWGQTRPPNVSVGQKRLSTWLRLVSLACEISEGSHAAVS